jgi:hypothetical protein
MATKNKDYLFRVGPVVFFPKSVTPESLPYKTRTEEYRNIVRLVAIFWYGFMTFVFVRDLMTGNRFNDFGSWTFMHYVVMLIPLLISVANLRMMLIEKQTKILMSSASRYLIYGSWVVSAAYYLAFAYNFLAT